MSIFKTIFQAGKFFVSPTRYSHDNQWKAELGTLYDLKVKNIDGELIDLSQYKGKVTLVCNVASECGLTKCGYQFLAEEFKKYADRDFVVLGFPCNQFGGQEPGGPNEIKEFATTNFDAKFPLMEKVDVNGPSQHPVYTFLKSCFPGDVMWNFSAMFVIDENGVPVRRFAKEKYPEIDQFIKQALDDRDARKKEAPAAEAAAAPAAEAAAAPAAAPAAEAAAAAPSS